MVQRPRKSGQASLSGPSARPTDADGDGGQFSSRLTDVVVKRARKRRTETLGMVEDCARRYAVSVQEVTDKYERDLEKEYRDFLAKEADHTAKIDEYFAVVQRNYDSLLSSIENINTHHDQVFSTAEAEGEEALESFKQIIREELQMIRVAQGHGSKKAVMS